MIIRIENLGIITFLKFILKLKVNISQITLFIKLMLKKLFNSKIKIILCSNLHLPYP